MTRFFEDGFEGNLQNWSTYTAILGSVEIRPFPFRGEYSGYFVTQPTLEEALAHVAKTVTADNIYVRAYFYIQQGVAAMQANDRFYLICLIGTDNQNTALIGIRREGTQAPKWVLWRRKEKLVTGGFAGGHIYGASPIDLTPQWFCLEVHYSKLTGEYQVYVNGNLEITDIVDSSQHPSIGRVEVGIRKTGATGTAYDPTGQYIIEVFGDQVVFADTYIGSELPPPSDGKINWVPWIVGGTAIVLGVSVALLKRRK